jgi:integrase/recombinase XerC
MAEQDALAPVQPPSAVAAPLGLDEDGARRLRDAFFSGRGENTRRAYEAGIADFAAFLSHRAGRPIDPVMALRELLAAGPGPANLLGLEWRTDLLARHLAPSTVALRLAAIRAAVKLARTLGMVAWSLEIPGVKVHRYRDTAGPGVEGVRAIADAARARDGAVGARDRALLALLFLRGLRRGETVSLDLEHVDLERGRVSVLGKGQLEREWFDLAPEAVEALRSWIAMRPEVPTRALLIGWSAVTRAPGGRLTGRGVAKIVARYGLEAAVGRVRPHGLRHAAATALLDLGLTWQEVAGFTRHKDPSTLRHYDDNRARRGTKAGRKLAKLVRL